MGTSTARKSLFCHRTEAKQGGVVNQGGGWRGKWGRTVGTGPLYQGRFKSFPVQEDEHFFSVCRYVERNALRVNLVASAQPWRWSS